MSEETKESRVKDETIAAFSKGLPVNQFGDLDENQSYVSGYKLIEKFPIEKVARLFKEAGERRPPLTLDSISSKGTIYRIMKQRPEEPLRIGRPVTVERLEASEGYQLLEKRYLTAPTQYGRKKPLNRRDWAVFKLHLLDAFSLLDRKPVESWEEEDYSKLWEKYYNPKIQNITTSRGTSYRRVMETFPKQTYLLKRFKTTHKPRGEKGLWSLTETELLRVIAVVLRKDMLVWILLSVSGGARMSALVNNVEPDRSLKPSHIQLETGFWQRWEQKEQKTVDGYLTSTSLEVVRRYIKQQTFTKDEPLFRGDLNNPEHKYWTLKDFEKKLHSAILLHGFYERLINKLGEDSGLEAEGKHMSSHIFKHSFAWNAAHLGMAGDIAEEIAGTELRTLKGFYGFGDKAKVKAVAQGLPMETNPRAWSEFLERIAKACLERMATIADGKKP